MKRCAWNRFRGLFASAVAVCMIGYGIAGCSSSDEEGTEEPTPELSNGENAEGAENAENAEGGSDEQLLNGDEGVANNAEGNNATGEENSNVADGEVPPVEGNEAFLENNSGNGVDNTNNLDNSALANDTTGEANATTANAPVPANNGTGTELESLVNESSPSTAGATAEGNFTDASTGSDPFAPEATPANNTASVAADPEPAALGAAPAEGSVVPEDGSLMPYFVRKGDTLSVIAGRIYGNAGRWHDLASLNNIDDPHRIFVGDVIYYKLDGKSRGFAEKFEGAPRGSVTVSKGQTLHSIAAQVYGSGAFWKYLWRDNPQVKDPDILSLGMTIVYRDIKGLAAINDESEGTASNVTIQSESINDEQVTAEEAAPELTFTGEEISGGILADQV